MCKRCREAIGVGPRRRAGPKTVAADFPRPIPKENLHCWPGCCGLNKLQVVPGLSEDHEVVGVELTLEMNIRAGHEPDTWRSASYGRCKAVDEEVEQKW